jgi:hypothetical protein
VTLDAARVVDGLKAAKMPVTSSLVYTRDSDPNSYIGHPGRYKFKAAFTDGRIDPTQAVETFSGSIELGGGVEVFADNSGALGRAKYIQSQLKDAGGFLGTEYDYVAGPVLLRLSGKLTQAEADVYVPALRTVTGVQPVRVSK